MIEDKRLKRAIKTAVKHGGCCLWINRNTGSVNFWTEDWRAVTDCGELRAHLRESMALIVEMLGYLTMTLIASFLLRWVEKMMDGDSSYELVQVDPLTMTAGTYSHPKRGSNYDERSKEYSGKERC